METVRKIFSELCLLAPLELQMGFDNSGFLFGREYAEVSKVLLALDITPAVVDEAIELGAELIVSHHPLIFSPLKSVTDEKLLKLAANNISVISMHTNLDGCPWSFSGRPLGRTELRTYRNNAGGYGHGKLFGSVQGSSKNQWSALL